MNVRIVFWLVLVVAPWSAATADLALQADFEGGSAKVVSIDQGKGIIRFRPGGDPSLGWPCWWYFLVTGVQPGRTITLELDMTQSPISPGWAMPDRATFSTDRKQWKHTPPGEKQTKSITYRQRVDAERVWFAWGPPFLPTDAAELVQRAAEKCPSAQPFQLCRTSDGRPVPALRVAQPGDANTRKQGIWIHARQHAWETGSSWVCCGLAEWMVSDDPRAESLRKKADIVLVPIMDVDNVARGQGGKNQRPHDHNRDWSEIPRFPAVAAAQREIRAMEKAGRFHFYLDLHNPGWNDLSPFFNSPEKSEHPGASFASVERFVAGARQEITGPIAYKGIFRQTGPKYDPKAWQVMSEHWVRRNVGPQAIVMALEIPWNTPQSTVEGYKVFGRQLGLAIESYFRTESSTASPTKR